MQCDYVQNIYAKSELLLSCLTTENKSCFIEMANFITNYIESLNLYDCVVRTAGPYKRYYYVLKLGTVCVKACDVGHRFGVYFHIKVKN